MYNNNNPYYTNKENEQLFQNILRKTSNINEILQFIPHPSIILNKDCKILCANSLLMDFFNIFDNHEDFKILLENYITPSEFDMFNDWFDSFFNGSKPSNSILLNLERNKCAGKTLLSGKIVPIADNTFLLLTITDLTNSMDEVSTLIPDKNEDLKEALVNERRKSEFILNLSHDLRTPLNVILGTVQLTELSLKDSRKINNEILNRRVSVIKQNCYRLLKIINNLIDISRIDVGYKSVELNNLNIVSLVKDMVESITEYAENKMLSLNFKSDKDELIIACDTDKIERIMFNLLSNAIKFSNKDGIIDVIITADKKWVTITVSDNGIGIPKDKLKSIFKRFKQVNDDLSSRSGGSGIGLSLVKSLVELLKGTISVQSTQGIGSTFTVSLPNKKINKRNSKESLRLNEHVNIKPDLERIKIEFSDL